MSRLRLLLAALRLGGAVARRARARAAEGAPPVAGTIAEFADAEGLTAAVRAARIAGWTRLEAYAPHPVPEAALALGARAAPIGWIAVGAGTAAAIGIYGFSWYASTRLFPLNIGGRPPYAWPVFLPPAYIVGVLVAAIAALVAMLLLNRLPRLNHPVFAVPGFGRASEDRFFLFLAAEDPRFETDRAARFLRGLAPLRVVPVPLGESPEDRVT